MNSVGHENAPARGSGSRGGGDERRNQLTAIAELNKHRIADQFRFVLSEECGPDADTTSGAWHSGPNEIQQIEFAGTVAGEEEVVERDLFGPIRSEVVVAKYVQDGELADGNGLPPIVPA